MRTETISTPPLYILDGIRKLNGEPKITFPTPSTRLKKIERVLSVPRAKAELKYGTRDPKIKTARLVFQTIVGGNAQTVDVYRVYLTKATPEQQVGWGYQISYPTADPDYPKITWQFRIEDRDYEALPDGATCPIPGFETLVIITQDHQPSTDGAFFGTETRVYERIAGAPMTTEITDESGLAVTVLSQVVDPTTPPQTGYLVQADVLTSINTRQAQRDQRIIAEFPTQPGQLYDESLSILIPFEDRTVARDATLPVGEAESSPMDYARRRDRYFTIPHAALQAFVRRFGTFVNLNLPAELLEIQIAWETGGGDGFYQEMGTGIAEGASASLALSPRGSAQSSASVMPEVVPKIRRYSASPLQAQDVVFYTVSATMGAILTRLADILSDSVEIWPSFQEQIYRFVLSGQKVSVSANTSVSNSVNLSQSSYSYAYSEGQGVDGDEATSLRSVDIGPVINGALSLIGDTTLARSAEAISFTSLVSGTNWPGGSASSIASATANGAIYPTTLPATSPAEIPTTGLYVTDVRCEVYKYGYNIVRATVINAAHIQEA